MEVSKVNLLHIMLWEFEQGNNSMGASRNISSVQVQGVITNWQVRNWFATFRSAETLDKPDFDFDDKTLRSSVEINPRQSTKELAKMLHTSQSTIFRYLGKIGKVSKPNVWDLHSLSEKYKAGRFNFI